MRPYPIYPTRFLVGIFLFFLGGTRPHALLYLELKKNKFNA